MSLYFVDSHTSNPLYWEADDNLSIHPFEVYIQTEMREKSHCTPAGVK